MKKDLKVILMSAIASITTATIIFVSGGGVVIATLLGGAGILTIPSIVHLNDKRNNKNNTYSIVETDEIQNDIQVINVDEEVYELNSKKTDSESKQSIAPIKRYDDKLIVQELITIDALTQKESVLVRTRKKEKEEKFKENNNFRN